MGSRDMWVIEVLRSINAIFLTASCMLCVYKNGFERIAIFWFTFLCSSPNPGSLNTIIRGFSLFPEFVVL